MTPKSKKCSQLTENVPNGHKTSQMSVKIFQKAITYINIFQSKALLKFTQIEIFGLEISHLATLIVSLSDSFCELEAVSLPQQIDLLPGEWVEALKLNPIQFQSTTTIIKNRATG
jgi:hypothetical protein